jgi:uncharacterized SAM-binding protein YcdF (DUF218 family)
MMTHALWPKRSFSRIYKFLCPLFIALAVVLISGGLLSYWYYQQVSYARPDGRHIVIAADTGILFLGTQSPLVPEARDDEFWDFFYLPVGLHGQFIWQGRERDWSRQPFWRRYGVQASFNDVNEYLPASQWRFSAFYAWPVRAVCTAL